MTTSNTSRMPPVSELPALSVVSSSLTSPAEKASFAGAASSQSFTCGIKQENNNDARLALLRALRKYEYPENYLSNLLQFLDISQLDVSKMLSSSQSEKLAVLLAGLEQDTPVEYLVGKADFYGRSFRVNLNVLIPRSDTEPLVEHSLQLLKNMPNTTVIDCGAGSGALAITLALELQNKSEEYMFVATDISPDALTVAKENAKQLNANSIDFYLADVVPEIDGTFHLPQTENVFIITNPPYIPDHEMLTLPRSVKDYEPDLALRRNVTFIDRLQKYAQFLNQNGKQVSFAIEYSKDGKMEHYYATCPPADLRELLSL